MASKGLQFTQHISTGSGTSTSFPGIHASSLPLDHGYAGLNEDHTSLAEVLTSNAIQTLGVTAQTSCSSIYNYDRGFDEFKDWPPGASSESGDIRTRLVALLSQTIKSNPIISPVASKLKFQYDKLRLLYDAPPCPYPRAEIVTETSLSLVDNHIDPAEEFFIWIHYMEPHMPHYPPEECVERFHDGNFDIGRIRLVDKKTRQALPEIVDGSMIEAVSEKEIEAVKDFYAAATRYVDHEAKRLITGLESRGMLEDSVVLFTADHGEELFDHGTLGHRPKMYEELVHVPFIVYDKNGRFHQEGNINSVTGHLDLAPTITDIFGVNSPKDWQGISLIDSLDDGSEPTNRDHAIAELCHTSGLGGNVNLDEVIATVRSDTWKYIQNRQLEIEQLFNLESDPNECHNVAAENSDVLSAMQNKLDARLENITEKEKENEVSKEVKKQLEELGYVE